MSPLRRLFVAAFWAATLFAYIAAIVPAREAPHLGWSDKLDHVAAFVTIAVLARLAYPRILVVLLFTLLAGFGGFIEISQASSFIHRDAELNDWLADLAAIAAGLIVAWPLAIAADRRRARRALAAEENTPPAREQ